MPLRAHRRYDKVKEDESMRTRLVLLRQSHNGRATLTAPLHRPSAFHFRC